MMEVLLVLVLALGCGLWGLGHSSGLRRPVWYHPDPETWETARSVCRSEHGGELLTMETQEDLDLDLSSYYAWIGITRDTHYFYWGTRGSNYTLTHWPLREGDECAYASNHSNRMAFFDCSRRNFFFCSDEFMNQTLIWKEAYVYCKTKEQRLLTFPSLDLHAAGSPVPRPHEIPVWIGLHSEGASWSWSDGQRSDYRNWASVPAPDPAPGSCVSVGSQSKSMSVHSCSDAFPFVCSKPDLVLLQEPLSWEQAVVHCENLSSSTSSTFSSTSSTSFRLLTVDQSHMETIKNVLRFAQTNKVWVGLRFLAGSWFWSDGAAVSLSLSSCPEGHCGALNISSSSIEPSDCSEELNALCYGSGHKE